MKLLLISDKISFQKFKLQHLDPNGDPDLDTDNCWICTYCGKKYRTRKGCKAHEAFRHDRGKLRHRCNHVDAQGKACESAFYDPKELQIHQRKHTGELPFICGYCGARYISKATLVQHEKAKHLETEVSNYDKDDFQSGQCIIIL